ncbi:MULTISPECIES: ATP-binding cassette domain-containing protein [Plesiomonas]|uniref:ATP-binding cassette domain-containing protein n=1 Tax=Plesiomonas TaxID=702 RepID=UPI001261F871|nr:MULTISPECIES: ATP-binding cassette domain-containing protein [Plesiomonas]KAB7674743.1 ATP-binding cassette domain-containing protein [Plesiomonas shigelloides]KAB7687223.1 ATP-binding cassette domain-containing protein [Plesiomonas shigelloides]MCE5163662.1 ATP-binding cassette domain-containing protein [Plesiomonas sp. PI-19]MCQ8857346.1 ATP-binding cassette domain-containing protein [Plesiomonas shigelloides]QOH81079.1 ATP-binding cassette domain-containing protein [Plesiomonas shigelloi
MLQLKQFGVETASYRWFGRPRWQARLQDINLQLHPGELVALVGASGAGKSLLVQGLLELLPPHTRRTGKICITELTGSAQSPSGKSPAPHRLFSYIPQSVAALNPLRTIGAQLQRAGELAGIPPSQREPHIASLLQRHQLDDGIQQLHPHQISGGMAKRTLICCASLHHSRYLLADEVTAWLDDDNARATLRHLRERCEAGCGVLWITHDLALAAEYADRVAVLHAGRLVETLSSTELRRGEGSAYVQALWQALPQHGFHVTDPAQLQELARAAG